MPNLQESTKIKILSETEFLKVCEVSSYSATHKIERFLKGSLVNFSPYHLLAGADCLWCSCFDL